MMGPFVVGCAVAGVLYVLIMPHLSTWVELSVLTFGVACGFSYVYWQPRQNLGKLGGLVPFLVLTGIQNEQSYSFADYANSASMIVLTISIVIVVSYIPSSPRPEKEFLRPLGRFFRRAAFVMARLALDGEHTKAWAGRWKTVLYRNDLLELPEKLRTLGQQIDHRTLPENTPEQVQALVTSLFGLAL